LKDTLKPKVETSPGRAWIFSSGGLSPLSPDAERFFLIGAMIFAITLPLPITWLAQTLYPVAAVAVSHMPQP